MPEESRSAETLEAAATTLVSVADESRSAIRCHIAEVQDFAAAVSGAGEVLAKLGEGDLHAAVALLARACAEIQTKNTALEARFDTLQEKFGSVQNELASARSEAATDPLTGLANRRSFDRSLVACVEHAEKSLKNLALVVCDIDDFKAFNDRHGHLVGDQVLRFVGKVMQSNVREGDVVARYGGEEFALILFDCELEAAVIIAERIRSTLATKVITKRSTAEKIGNVTLSLGVASFRAGMSPVDFFNVADKLLYTSKRSGKNRISTPIANMRHTA